MTCFRFVIACSNRSYVGLGTGLLLISIGEKTYSRHHRGRRDDRHQRVTFAAHSRCPTKPAGLAARREAQIVEAPPPLHCRGRTLPDVVGLRAWPDHYNQNKNHEVEFVASAGLSAANSLPQVAVPVGADPTRASTAALPLNPQPGLLSVESCTIKEAILRLSSSRLLPAYCARRQSAPLHHVMRAMSATRWLVGGRQF